jgi:hypothetical protein
MSNNQEIEYNKPKLINTIKDGYKNMKNINSDTWLCLILTIALGGLVVSQT